MSAPSKAEEKAQARGVALAARSTLLRAAKFMGE
jgi:hypothetical protein